MVKTVEHEEVMAKISGINSSRKEISFDLKEKEIKHIRRVLMDYDFYHSRYLPEEYNFGDLTKEIYTKFKLFGSLKRNITSHQKNAKMRGVEEVCCFPGCTEKHTLTRDHKIRKCNPQEGINSRENLQYLCPKHHLLKELETLKLHKEQELQKVIMRIEEIKEKNTTDCLGYISIPKFRKEI